jgi:hypothetical protein
MLKTFSDLVNIGAFAIYVVVVVTLGVILWSSLFSSEKIEDHANNTQTAQTQQHGANEHADGSGATPSAHSSAEQTIADYTKVVGIFTGLLVLATIFLFVSGEKNVDAARKSAKAAQDAADVARDTLIAANRAWIKIESVTIAGPLGFGREYGDDVGGGVDLIIHVKNIGNSPAVRVGADVRLSANFDHLANQKEFCDAIRKSLDPVLAPNALRPENSLFPNEETKIRVRAWTHPNDIKKAFHRAANMPDNKADLAVVGCIHYELPVAPGWHQTGIILDLKKKTLYPENIGPASYSTVPKEAFIPNLRTHNPDRISDGVRLEGAIPADDLVLSRNLVGIGPID